MIEVISFNSKVIQEKINVNYKVKNLKNTSILTAISNQDSTEEVVKAEVELTLLKDIVIKNNIFIFDFLQELSKFIRIKEAYIKEAIFNDIASESSLKLKKEVIDILSLNKDFYREVLKVFFNKIVRETHSSKIILIKVLFSEEYKIIDGNKVELDNEEKLNIKIINEYLFDLYSLYKEILPDGRVIECGEYLYLVDSENLKYSVEKALIEEINEKLEKEISNIEIFKDEKIYASYNNIKYYFQKAKICNKDRLIIIFSAFSNDKPKYNYVNSLRLIDCNKLFILDEYCTKGTYYIGENGDFNIEASVMALISSIMSEYDISFKNVICAGSSKGGTAALYYGIKYNFGNIIAGAPQYKIGTYLMDLTVKEYAKEIFGDLQEKNRIKYNNIIRGAINKNSNRINILTGEGDPQYVRVLKDFENVAEEFKLNVTIDKCDIKSHSDISGKFPDYLTDKLQDIFENGYIKANTFTKAISKSKGLINEKIRKKRGL